MVERIQELIRKKKLTPSQFADEIGIQRSGISHIISGRNKPSLEFILKILKRYPELKPEWLLYGNVTPGQETVQGEATEQAPETEKEKGNGKVPADNTPVTLFESPDVTDMKPELKLPRSLKREKTGRKIEKIVVFYDDRTFREYDPEQ